MGEGHGEGEGEGEGRPAAQAGADLTTINIHYTLGTIFVNSSCAACTRARAQAGFYIMPRLNRAKLQTGSFVAEIETPRDGEGARDRG
jgi:hypothetical protein